MLSPEIEKFFEYMAKNDKMKFQATIVGTGPYCIGFIDAEDQTIPWICGFESARDAEFFMGFVRANLNERDRPKKQPDNPEDMESVIQAMMGGRRKKSGPKSGDLRIFTIFPAASDDALSKLQEAFERPAHDPGI